MDEHPAYLNGIARSYRLAHCPDEHRRPLRHYPGDGAIPDDLLAVDDIEKASCYVLGQAMRKRERVRIERNPRSNMWTRTKSMATQAGVSLA